MTHSVSHVTACVEMLRKLHIETRASAWYVRMSKARKRLLRKFKGLTVPNKETNHATVNKFKIVMVVILKCRNKTPSAH